MRTTRVARRYAQALMTVAEETHTVDATAADLDLVQQVISTSRDFQLFLKSPVVSLPRKKTVLRTLFGERVGKITMAFFDLLVTKQREVLIPEIVQQFHALYDDARGIVTVDVTSAVALTGTQETALTGELERYTKKKVRVRYALEKALRGGLVARIGDTVLDGSVTHQLEILRERFAQGGPISN